jgi:hypothetical protein
VERQPQHVHACADAVQSRPRRRAARGCTPPLGMHCLLLLRPRARPGRLRPLLVVQVLQAERAPRARDSTARETKADPAPPGSPAGRQATCARCRCHRSSARWLAPARQHARPRLGGYATCMRASGTGGGSSRRQGHGRRRARAPVLSSRACAGRGEEMDRSTIHACALVESWCTSRTLVGAARAGSPGQSWKRLAKHFQLKFQGVVVAHRACMLRACDVRVRAIQRKEGKAKARHGACVQWPPAAAASIYPSTIGS